MWLSRAGARRPHTPARATPRPAPPSGPIHRGARGGARTGGPADMDIRGLIFGEPKRYTARPRPRRGGWEREGAVLGAVLGAVARTATVRVEPL